MKVAILSNQARSMAVFWRVLICQMIAENIEVVCITPPGDADSGCLLQNMGARSIHYPLDRKGINPVKDLASFFALKKIFAREKPDLLFATTIKPVIYGCYAAWLTGVPAIYATITGLGYAFENDTLPKKLINLVSCRLYRHSLKYASGIFFQNQDDRNLFITRRILEPDARILFAAGTGVDVKKFSLAPLQPVEESGAVNFLLVARLLAAKGIDDYARAAQIVKRQYPLAKFQLLGPAESGPGAFDKSKLAEYTADGSIEYLGVASDVRPYIAASHVAVLPSWREGTPTSIMEAMSMGRPCVVTDVPGCREVVKERLNGFLVPPGDPEALAGAMLKFVEHAELIRLMGMESRKIVLKKFDAERVAAGILRDMGINQPERQND